MHSNKQSNIEVIIEDLKSHPCCAHGPTLLFSRIVNSNGLRRRFFACSACRDRKGCPFFVWEGENKRVSKDKSIALERENCKLMPKIDHQKCFIQLNKVLQTTEKNRFYCHTCSVLYLHGDIEKHKDHKIMKGISNEVLNKPSEIFLPLNDNKKEAQYLFSKSSVEFIVNSLLKLDIKHFICIGAPRIHEYINNLNRSLKHHFLNCSSILLDIDQRHCHFYGPLEFCWYNFFNNHFFNKESKMVFQDYVQANGADGLCLITDPPFGGRLEPIADTLTKITKMYQRLCKTEENLPTLIVMPYFMESWIKYTMPDLKMCDYKIAYENHSQFKNGFLGRNLGSPVRVFTNIPLSKLQLPVNEGYNYCPICDRWVGVENKHCYICNQCTSKDGRTYVHCDSCKRCVKPTWQHCRKCNRCCHSNHKCGEVVPAWDRSSYHKSGHKADDRPKVPLPKICKRKTTLRVKPDSSKKTKVITDKSTITTNIVLSKTKKISK